jgi:hypothetical protein
MLRCHPSVLDRTTPMRAWSKTWPCLTSLPASRSEGTSDKGVMGQRALDMGSQRGRLASLCFAPDGDGACLGTR